MTILVLFVSTAVLAVATSSFLLVQRHLFETQRVKDLQSISEITAFNAAAALAFEDKEACDRLLMSLRSKQFILGAALYGPNGKLIAQYNPNRAPLNFERLSTLAPGYSQSGRLQYFHQLVHEKQDLMGRLLIVSDRTDLYKAFSTQLMLTAGLLLGCVVLALLLARLFQRLILAPLERLVREINTIALKKDYSRRVPQQTSDEIGHLIGDFNHMLAEIE